MVAIGPGRFARQAAATFRHEATALGLVLVDGGDRADAVLACGSVEWEISLFRKFRARELLRGGLSPGLTAFPSLLRGDSEGYLAPVQWHPDVRVEPQLGPPSVQLEDYVAAQAYAACLIAEHCLELEPDDPYAAGRRLRTTTFFGPFELAEDGLQIGHRLSVVRWSGNRRQLLAADVL
jgi:hypothetical protein